MTVIKELEKILKLDIETRNLEWNRLISKLIELAQRNFAPLLLCGAAGTGKTTLIRRYFDCKKQLGLVKGPFVEVNCSILDEQETLAALFGIEKQGKIIPGALAEAGGGMLFLDRADFLSNEGRRRFLDAIESGKYRPIGSREHKPCDFLLASAVNTENQFCDAEGADFLSRIGLWRLTLPSLRERPEDIPPNIEFELAENRKKTNVNYYFLPEAYADYIAFAKSPQALWNGNFRDLIQSIQRMIFLSKNGCIDSVVVQEEKERLFAQWRGSDEEDLKTIRASVNTDNSESLSSADYQNIFAENISPVLNKKLDSFDEFDRLQLLSILEICRKSESIAAAGRRLFAKSRLERQSINDSDRLRKYLDKFGLTWEMVKG